MEIRTDLAMEAAAGDRGQNTQGVRIEKYDRAGMSMTSVEILTEEAARRLKKPIGRYVTAEELHLTANFRDSREHTEGLAEEIRRMLPESGTVLVAGLGNREITADALGPKSISYILATRHFQGELAKSTGLDRLRSVAAVATGVLGQTGLEATELICSIVRSIRPCALIAIDALAARSASRLGNTVQIGNSGIAPGSGVGNHRMALNEETLGLPVIGIGVPTVVDAAALAYDLLQPHETLSEKTLEERLGKNRALTVTPGNIDVLTDRAAKLVGMAVNCALHSSFDFDTLAALTS